MAKLDDLIEDLVTANHVLAKYGIVDSFGHVSIRHPDRPDRFFLSCSRAPERVKRDDIVEFNLDCEPIDAKGKHLYTERPIHGGAYQARPDVMSVIHNHSPGVIPYGITGHKMRPVMHMCASIGHEVPIWDQHKKFGDTDLLVRTMAQGHDLAKKLAKALFAETGAKYKVRVRSTDGSMELDSDTDVDPEEADSGQEMAKFTARFKALQADLIKLIGTRTPAGDKAKQQATEAGALAGKKTAQEALDAARRISHGPERSEALKKAGQLRLVADAGRARTASVRKRVLSLPSSRDRG